MSRDTRLDRLLEIFGMAFWKVEEAQGSREELAAARRAIEERDLRQRRELVLADKMAMAVEGALRDYQNTALADAHGDYCMVRFALPAASLSVSPVPSEPRELLCQKCGRDYPVWFAQNHLWNRVADGRWHFLCLDCFAIEAESLGIIPTAWALLEESELDALHNTINSGA